LYNYFIVLFKIAFILIQPLAARTTINVCVCVCLVAVGYAVHVVNVCISVALG